MSDARKPSRSIRHQAESTRTRWNQVEPQRRSSVIQYGSAAALGGGLFGYREAKKARGSIAADDSLNRVYSTLNKWNRSRARRGQGPIGPGRVKAAQAAARAGLLTSAAVKGALKGGLIGAGTYFVGKHMAVPYFLGSGR